MAVPISVMPPGSGTAGTTLVSAEELVTDVVPSRFTSTVKAKPFARSLVRVGIVPVGSENMLHANALPESEMLPGELRAGLIAGGFAIPGSLRKWLCLAESALRALS